MVCRGSGMLQFDLHLGGFHCAKKGRRGCHLSKRAQWNYASCSSKWSTQDPCSCSIVRIVWRQSDPKRELCMVSFQVAVNTLLTSFFGHLRWPMRCLLALLPLFLSEMRYEISARLRQCHEPTRHHHQEQVFYICLLGWMTQENDQVFTELCRKKELFC